MARAAAHDGFFPVNLTSADQLAEAVAGVRALHNRGDGSRDGGRPFTSSCHSSTGSTPRHTPPQVPPGCYTDFDPATLTLDAVRGVLHDGPVLA